MKFINGATYKLYRQDGNLAERTAKVTGISRKNEAIRFEIIGSELEGFSKISTVILDLKQGNENELASSFNFRQYLTISAKDIL